MAGATLLLLLSAGGAAPVLSVIPFTLQFQYTQTTDTRFVFVQTTPIQLQYVQTQDLEFTRK